MECKNNRRHGPSTWSTSRHFTRIGSVAFKPSFLFSPHWAGWQKKLSSDNLLDDVVKPDAPKTFRRNFWEDHQIIDSFLVVQSMVLFIMPVECSKESKAIEVTHLRVFHPLFEVGPVIKKTIIGINIDKMNKQNGVFMLRDHACCESIHTSKSYKIIYAATSLFLENQPNCQDTNVP